MLRSVLYHIWKLFSQYRTPFVCCYFGLLGTLWWSGWIYDILVFLTDPKPICKEPMISIRCEVEITINYNSDYPTTRHLCADKNNYCLVILWYQTVLSSHDRADWKCWCFFGKICLVKLTFMLTIRQWNNIHWDYHNYSKVHSRAILW